MTDPGLDPIPAYLREHAGRYGVEALRRELLRSGYGPAATDRAVQAFREENPPRLRELVWPKALRVLRVNALLAGAGVALACAPRMDDDVKLGIVLTLLAILCLELLGGLVLVFPRKRRALGLALLAGLFLSVALGALVLKIYVDSL
ncbi:MAG: hypothetical protein ACJ76N_14345 [Thermoanaerobaculia bacterium]